MSNILASANAQVVVCGTAMTVHSMLASAVHEIPVMGDPRHAQAVALGNHLKPWTSASAKQFLMHFIVPRHREGAVGDSDSEVIGGAGDSSCARSSAGLGVLDIIDVPGLFPCASRWWPPRIVSSESLCPYSSSLAPSPSIASPISCHMPLGWLQTSLCRPPTPHGAVRGHANTPSICRSGQG